MARLSANPTGRESARAIRAAAKTTSAAATRITKFRVLNPCPSCIIRTSAWAPRLRNSSIQGTARCQPACYPAAGYCQRFFSLFHHFAWSRRKPSQMRNPAVGHRLRYLTPDHVRLIAESNAVAFGRSPARRPSRQEPGSDFTKRRRQPLGAFLRAADVAAVYDESRRTKPIGEIQYSPLACSISSLKNDLVVAVRQLRPLDFRHSVGATQALGSHLFCQATYCAIEGRSGLSR